jgi:uncharacterized NAD(P)/FAD-binding protein YdhS
MRGSVSSGRFDVVIVGGGRAGASVLLRLLERSAALGTPLNAAVVDPHHRIGAGTVYGEATARDSLIVTDLETFFADEELSRFERWLRIAGSSARTGALHGCADTAELRKQYVPRRLIGSFFEREVQAALATAGPNHAVTIVRSVVTGIAPSGSGYAVEHRNGRIEARAVLLAVGSPEIDGIAEDPRVIASAHVASTEHMRVRVRTALAGRRSGSIGVVGSNASALEAIYVLENDPLLKSAGHRYHVISTHGALPNLEGRERFGPASDPVAPPCAASTADELFDAVVRYGKGVTDRANPGLALLGETERRRFMALHADAVIRLRRKAGGPYAGRIRELLRAGRLELARGTYVGSSPDGHARTVLDTGDVVDLGPFEVILMCVGSARHPPGSRCQGVNGIDLGGLGLRWSATGRGLEVSESFEARSGLFVHGPLLSGYVRSDLALLHLEDAQLIAHLSAEVARQLMPSHSNRPAPRRTRTI